jgi:Flp pilus assembly protein TadD
MRRFVFVAICVIGLNGSAWAAGGEEDLPTPKPNGTPQLSGEAKYNEGLAFTRAQDWQRAEISYRAAITLKPELPEAWNELGHALKRQGRLEESIPAYEQALRLRPKYPQALEYLGEAYVLLGRLGDARALHARLQPLDPKLAQQLASAIDSGDAAW